jgi:hypothetical protein
VAIIKNAPEVTRNSFDLAKIYGVWMGNCDVGDSFDIDFEEDDTDEEVRKGLQLAATQTLNRKLRFSYPDGKTRGTSRVIRFFVTSIPVNARTVRTSNALPSIRDQAYYDNLMRESEVGGTYDYDLDGTSLPTARKRLDDAARFVHGKRVEFEKGRENGRQILRYHITDRPAASKR